MEFHFLRQMLNISGLKRPKKLKFDMFVPI